MNSRGRQGVGDELASRLVSPEGLDSRALPSDPAVAERRDVGVAISVDYQPTAAPPPSNTESNLECKFEGGTKYLADWEE
ncbi:hypothetical protein VTG60DRAFT_4992 [Thermothelomyces hinnuleus]